MAHDIDLTETPVQPSREAIEHKPTVGISEQEKLDRIAMKAAKRGEHRIQSNKEGTPGNKMFTK